MGVEFRGVFQRGQGEKSYTRTRRSGRLLGGLGQVGQEGGPFAGAGVGDRHPDDVRPLGVEGVARQQPEVPVLHRRPRAQVVLEGAVDELDGAEGGFAEQAAADEKVAQDRGGVALRGGGREGRQDVGDDAFGTVAVHLGLVVADEPVGQALEELDLREFREMDAAGAFGREHVALLVTARQQHGQGGVVQLLPAVRQIAPPVAVQRADQPAHQRVGGESAEVGFGADGGEEGVLVAVETVGVRGVEPGRRVPAADEGGDVVAAHGGEGELGEAVGGEPVLADGRGAGGHQPLVAGIDVQQFAQPAAGPLTVAFGDLVDAVDEEQPAPGAEDAVAPAIRLGGVEGHAGGGEETVGFRESVGAAYEGAQGQDERDPVAALAPGRGHGQPLHEGGLAGAGHSAQQHQVLFGEGLFGGEGAAGGRDVCPARAGRLRVLGGPYGPQAEVGGVEGPALGGVDEIDAVDGEPAVLGRDVREVPLFEGGIRAAGRRSPRDQLVDLGDELALPAALLHQRAGHEGRALGEEVQDVQAGRAQDPLVEQGRVEGEVPLGVAARGAQPQGERLVTEFHGLYVGHGEVAEGVQGVGEGVDDGLLLVGGQRAFPGAQGSCDQLGGQRGQLFLPEGPFLSPEGDEPGDPQRLLDQPCARPVRHEQLPDEWRDHARGQFGTYGCWFHDAPPDGTVTAAQLTLGPLAGGECGRGRGSRTAL